MSSRTIVLNFGVLGDKQVTVDYHFSPFSPGRYSGPPEHCYPDEPAELDITSINWDSPLGMVDILPLLSQDEFEIIHDELFEIICDEHAEVDEPEPDYPDPNDYDQYDIEYENRIGD